MSFPFGETITRIQPGLVDDPYSGEQKPDWEHPVMTQIPGCVLYPLGSTSESVDVGRPEQPEQTLTVLLPPGVKLDPPDRVIARGETFDVIGFTFQYASPFTGWAPGGQATIRRQLG